MRMRAKSEEEMFRGVNPSMEVLGRARIVDRDHQILKLCYEQKFITLEHVESFFPARSAKFAASRRVGLLRGAGLLKVVQSPMLKRYFILTLTKLGEAYVTQKLSIEIDNNLKPLQSTLAHDSIVTSVRLKLVSLLPNSKWLPERALKLMSLEHLPDGILKVSHDEFIVIEVENSIKWSQRYRSLMNTDWSCIPQITTVLYIATNENISRAISASLYSASDRPSYGVMNLSDLNSNRLEFVDKKRQILSLSRFKAAS